MNYSHTNEIFKNCENLGDKIIVKSDLHKIVEHLKNNYNFDILKEIIALDNNDGSFELIYNFYSTADEEKLLLSFNTKDEIAESIADLYDSATMDEKEIFDLFGINFLGHNDLKRLYMPESWSGHPLRKDYTNNDMRLNWND